MCTRSHVFESGSSLANLLNPSSSAGQRGREGEEDMGIVIEEYYQQTTCEDERFQRIHVSRPLRKADRCSEPCHSVRSTLGWTWIATWVGRGGAEGEGTSTSSSMLTPNNTLLKQPHLSRPRRSAAARRPLSFSPLPFTVLCFTCREIINNIKN